MKIKDYHIQHELGRGGMATVFLAHDNKFDTNVAVKVLSKEFVHIENIRKRFLAEARNMFKMSHPNIIKVTDLIDEGDTVAFVMEYIEGETLKEYIDRKGKLNDAEIKNLFTQMLDAVGYVHEQNLVHRDIKPSNFMLDKKGRIKLMDFGIAKNMDVTSSEYTNTGTNQNMGTPMYMSPEQIKSTKDVTLQSDVYSLGVVLWQMVMGKKPYDTNTSSTFELQMKIVAENLSLTNSKFDSLIEVATAKELNIRYNNCMEFKSKLENLHKEISDNKNHNSSAVTEKTMVDNFNIKTVIENGNIIDKQVNNNHKDLSEHSLLFHIMPGLIMLLLLSIDYYNWFLYFTYGTDLSFGLLNYSLHGVYLIISTIVICCGFFVFRFRYFKTHYKLFNLQSKRVLYLVPGILMLIVTDYQFDAWERFDDNNPIHIILVNYSILPAFLLFSIISIAAGLVKYFLITKKGSYE